MARTYSQVEQMTGLYTRETRAVESESLKVGKSLKIGKKNRIKTEKSDLISY